MLKLEVVTPEKRVVDAEVDSVTIPTASGEVGIMPNHAPLISALKPGILSYSTKGQAERLALAGGFVEVSADKVSVLADTAEGADEIDAADAKAGREAAEKAIAAAGAIDADQAAAIRESLDHADARVQLSSGR